MPTPRGNTHVYYHNIGQVVSEEKMFEYYGNIHVYCPGVWAYDILELLKLLNSFEVKIMQEMGSRTEYLGSRTEY